jgi:hypothetical protein
MIWMVYLAAEPYVRRRWPQCLISWASALSGRFHDAIVGRDVLIGAALGVSFSVIDIVMNLPDWKYMNPIFNNTAMLDGTWSTVGGILVEAPQGIRGAVFFVFLIFLLRVVLRNQVAAGVVFSMIFALLNFLANGNSWLGFAGSMVVYGSLALVTLRWGILASCVGIFIGNTAFNFPLTMHAGAWYFGNAMLATAMVLAMIFWGAWTALGDGRRIFRTSLFES